MSATCGVCGRTGEVPASMTEAGPTPWGLLQITELWKAGDSSNEPEVKIMVCSKICAIKAVLESSLRKG